LLASLLSLVICISMLVGSTFAWFTDSVTSANNIIKSGNLDVTLEWMDGKDAPADPDDAAWQDASDKAIFDYNLWEPGYTTVRHIKIGNEGSLALKYKVVIEANGTVSDLTDVIDVYYFDPAQQIADRTALAGVTPMGTLTSVLGNMSTTAQGELAANTDDVITIALKMKETAGNEYMNKQVGDSFAIKVFATQLAAESDSFGNDYDVFADYDGEISTPAALVDALKKGGTYKLVADITLDEGDVADIPAGTVVKLDLDNKTITGGMQAGNTTKHVYPIENHGTLTLAGNGVVNGRGVANYGTLTIEDGTYNAIDDNGGAPVWNYAGSDVTVNGGTFVTADDTTAPGPTAMNIASGATAVINGGKFVGAANQTYGIINDGTLTINDIEISADHGVVSNSGTLEINGGKFTQNGNLVQTSSLIYTTAGTATINGGEFIFNKDGKLDSGLPVYCAGGSVAINGGYFGGNIVTEMISSWGGAGTASVTGGTFAKKPGYIATEHIAVENADGTWSVVSVVGKTLSAEGLYVGNDNDYAVVSADGLVNLNAMMANKTAGENVTVELLADVDMTGKTWTPVDSHADTAFTFAGLNGNGHAIKNLTINGQAMFKRFAGTGDVTVKDVTFYNANIDSTENGTVTNNNLIINTSILTVQTYQNVLLDNVDVKNSSIMGGYKVAPLIGTVYNESASSITCTVKNCDVSDTVVTSTKYDFFTCGMISFVYTTNNDFVEYENCSITNVQLKARSGGYNYHANIHYTSADTDDQINEHPEVKVTNVTFENL